MTTFGGTDLAATLEMIVRRHGTAVLDQRQRLFALLRDHAPGDFRAIRLLMSGFDSGAASRFRQLDRAASPRELEEETRRIVDEYGSEPALAWEAVDTWARLVAALKGLGAPVVRPLPYAGANPSAGPGGHVSVLPLPGAGGAPQPPGAAPGGGWRALAPSLRRWLSSLSP